MKPYVHISGHINEVVKRCPLSKAAGLLSVTQPDIIGLEQILKDIPRGAFLPNDTKNLSHYLKDVLTMENLTNFCQGTLSAHFFKLFLSNIKIEKVSESIAPTHEDSLSFAYYNNDGQLCGATFYELDYLTTDDEGNEHQETYSLWVVSKNVTAPYSQQDIDLVISREGINQPEDLTPLDDKKAALALFLSKLNSEEASGVFREVFDADGNIKRTKLEENDKKTIVYSTLNTKKEDCPNNLNPTLEEVPDFKKVKDCIEKYSAQYSRFVSLNNTYNPENCSTIALLNSCDHEKKVLDQKIAQSNKNRFLRTAGLIALGVLLTATIVFLSMTGLILPIAAIGIAFAGLATLMGLEFFNRNVAKKERAHCDKTMKDITTKENGIQALEELKVSIEALPSTIKTLISAHNFEPQTTHLAPKPSDSADEEIDEEPQSPRSRP